MGLGKGNHRSEVLFSSLCQGYQTRLITDEVMFVRFFQCIFLSFLFHILLFGSKSLRVVQVKGTEGPGEWGIKFRLLEEVVSINISFGFLL